MDSDPVPGDEAVDFPAAGYYSGHQRPYQIPVSPGNPVEKWQAFLWRSILEKTKNPSLPGQMDALLDAAANKKLPDLPHRICLFGLSMVPPSFTAFFSAVDTDVFLFLLTPSNPFFSILLHPDTWNGLPWKPMQNKAQIRQ